MDLGSSSALGAFKFGQTKALRFFDNEKQEHGKGSKDENFSANQGLFIRSAFVKHQDMNEKVGTEEMAVQLSLSV